jgi:hypothetical protein
MGERNVKEIKTKRIIFLRIRPNQAKNELSQKEKGLFDRLGMRRAASFLADSSLHWDDTGWKPVSLF